MTTQPILQLIRGLRGESADADRTDAQLLEAFNRHRDEPAFAAIVNRHGPMVFGVCRRMLGNVHDAEDAFQATFVVLLRKADSLRQSTLLANWLYGVACRVAMKSRATACKLKARECKAARPEAVQGDLGDELLPILDHELNRLPDTYRMAIVMCDLEGKTRKEAARRLGWPEGTVATRLTRGRELLARRLTKQGITLSAGTFATMLASNAASASVPQALVSATMRTVSDAASSQGAVPPAVAALCQGVLHGMAVSNWKAAGIFLLATAMIAVGNAAAIRLFWTPPAVQTEHQAQGKERREEAPPVRPPAEILDPGGVIERPKDPLDNATLNAGLDPDDPRIRAFVAYLNENGVPLTHVRSGTWYVRDPKPPVGYYGVSIRSFPPSATREQMHFAISEVNLAYRVNVPARIAISHVGGHGIRNAPEGQEGALGKRLTHLFRHYHPGATAGPERKGATPIKTVKETITFDPGTCVRGGAGFGFGLGTVGVFVLGRDKGRCWFDVYYQVEGGETVYECSVPEDGPDVRIAITNGSELETSFPLGKGKVVKTGGPPVGKPVQPALIWRQQSVPETSYVNYVADAVVGTGAEVKPGSRVTVRVTTYASERFDRALPGVKKDYPLNFRVGLNALGPGLDAAVGGMKAGGKRMIKMRQEVSGRIDAILGGVMPNTQIAVELELESVEEPPREPPGVPIRTEAEAFEFFAAEVAVHLPRPKQANDYWWSQLASAKPWSIKRQPFNQAFARVSDTLTPRERTTQILFGRVEDLKRPGECWAVEHATGLGSSLTGYLDAQTGRLVFVWMIPEG